MSRVKTLEEFRNFRKLVTGEPPDGKPCLVICAGTGGQASGSNDIIRIIKREIVDRELHDRLSLRITGCLGFCQKDPFILVEPGHHLYPKISKKHVSQIIDATLKGEIVEDLLYREPESPVKYFSQNEIPFFKGQTRTILGQNQNLDPIRILDYLRIGGYSALEKVLGDPNPEWIINEVKKSGLRGRGGAGFPTGKKWEMARKSGAPSTTKYIVCNADEGDPGAYMDRSLLEGNPHAILEGMIIAGMAIEATKGIIYVRSEYPLAIKHSLIAIRQARDLGFLGENILNTGINFDIEIFRGAGAFVCGEETALIASIEGKMGEPRQRPPYPISKGIGGQPTCINNVETLANIPTIINRGADEYIKVGVPGNTGTKIFSLVGKIKNTGLVEVPMGAKIKDIVYRIGGGSIGKAKIKAVQTGGPSGGCIPVSMFDLPIDYESLTQAGSIVGSGGMIVMDEDTCMVDVARYFMNFLKDESCGKCFTCRKGTQRMYEILDDISKGKGTLEGLELLEELALVVKDTTMCGLGTTASNPVLSTLRYYADEYLQHIKHKRCPAGVCKELVGAPCRSACPLGTETWRYVAHIARREYDEAYRAIREPNPLPAVCARVCHHPCEDRCRLGTTGNQPLAIRELKRFITDNVDPKCFRPHRAAIPGRNIPQVAVVGAGPSGLTVAHYLSLRGYRVTIFEAETQPGGMLQCGIPAYRMPRRVLKKQIGALLDENITLKCGVALGRDITIDDLFAEGFQAVYLAIGAHKSLRLEIEGEDARGVWPAMTFLKAFNLRGEQLAKRRVGVIGGGNSAIDAARVALRQKGVESVTILYRRTRQEMPAYKEEIEAALEEGVAIQTLISPVKVIAKKGRLTGLTCITNQLADFDSSGRQRPVAVAGTEHNLDLDTLIVAIGENTDTNDIAAMGLEVTKKGTLQINAETFSTTRVGVFAGGDVVTGPNTIVNAMAAGKMASEVIDRFLRGEKLEVPAERRLPEVYIAPVEVGEEERLNAKRIEPGAAHVSAGKLNFREAARALSAEEAQREARRCLRCDLEFTQPAQDEMGNAQAGGESA